MTIAEMIRDFAGWGVLGDDCSIRNEWVCHQIAQISHSHRYLCPIESSAAELIAVGAAVQWLVENKLYVVSIDVDPHVKVGMHRCCVTLRNIKNATCATVYGGSILEAIHAAAKAAGPAAIKAVVEGGG